MASFWTRSAAATAPDVAQERTHDHLFKVLIIGDSCVGKSQMLLRFVAEEFDSAYTSTIGVDFRICTRTVSGRVIKLTLWDTAGQERFRTITSCYYRGAHGVIVVYDITDKQSFNNARMWMHEIEKYCHSPPCKLLVGNKSDLASKRSVAFDEGTELAQYLGVQFLETSAKDNHNIEHAFNCLIQSMLADALKKEAQLPCVDSAPTAGIVLGAGSIGSALTAVRAKCCV